MDEWMRTGHLRKAIGVPGESGDIIVLQNVTLLGALRQWRNKAVHQAEQQELASLPTREGRRCWVEHQVPLFKSTKFGPLEAGGALACNIFFSRAFAETNDFVSGAEGTSSHLARRGECFCRYDAAWITFSCCVSSNTIFDVDAVDNLKEQ